MYGNYNTHQSSGKLTCKHLDITAFALGMLMWHPEKYSDQQLLTLSDIYSDLKSPWVFTDDDSDLDFTLTISILWDEGIVGSI